MTKSCYRQKQPDGVRGILHHLHHRLQRKDFADDQPDEKTDLLQTQRDGFVSEGEHGENLVGKEKEQDVDAAAKQGEGVGLLDFCDAVVAENRRQQDGKRVAEQADQHVWHYSDERLLKIAAVQRQTEHKEGNGGVK